VSREEDMQEKTRTYHPITQCKLTAPSDADTILPR